jgi:hypothetical protein
LLANVRLADVDRASLDRAARLDPVEVATLDAIHLDAAVELAGRSAINAA